MAVYSPINGLELKSTDTTNIYQDSIYGIKYIDSDGVLVKISSPASGGSMMRNEDGTYSDPYIGKVFSFDSKRKAFIPHYIPDDTLEPAHIEGDFLVANSTGRRFMIDANGHVLTPEEISFQAKHGEDLARIAKMEKDGTIDSYLQKAKERREETQQQLEKMRQEGTLDEYFSSLINNDEKTSNHHILDEIDTLIENIGEQSKDTLDELMSYFDVGNVKVGNRTIHSYSDPLQVAKINARYRVLTGEDHPIFIERILPVIERYIASKEELLKVGGYFNDSFFNTLDNIKQYVTAQYSIEMVEHKERTLREQHQEQGLEFPDEYYEMEDLRERAQKGELSAEDLKKLCDITFGVDTKESLLIYNEMMKHGVVNTSMEEENKKLK